MNISQRKVRRYSGVLLLISLFTSITPIFAQPPLAMLSEVRGEVQIVRGGKTIAGKLGSQLNTTRRCL